MIRKRLTCPKWLVRIHYTGTVCLTLTMVFSVLCGSWFDPAAAFGGANFYLHIVSPLMILVSFFMVESGHELDMKDNLFAIIPTAAYGAWYYVHVIVRKDWEDLYHLNEIVPFFVSILLLFVLVFGLGWLIRIVYNRLLARRGKTLRRIWEDGPDPVTVRIEIYSLGVYAGLREEKNALTVPFDILEEVSERFGIRLEDLSRAYIKGAIEGLRGKETGNMNI